MVERDAGGSPLGFAVGGIGATVSLPELISLYIILFYPFFNAQCNISIFFISVSLF